MSNRKLAHYEITAKIGAGGMGEVYRARDTRLGRDVALKLLPEVFAKDEERLGRFKREAKLLAALNHPHVATLHGLEEADGEHFLVMELVEGEDLSERLMKGPIPINEALSIVRDIADALQAAHAAGIIHRDLKPANVKVTPEGKVKVLDFGLAKAFDNDPRNPDITQSPTIATALGTMGGVILGTAAYMSPEQARGKPVDKLTDVWALGAVLFEMLSGSSAFPGETVSDTIAKILEREPDWNALPANTPLPVQRLLRRCLEKDKSMRLQDVGEVRIEAAGALSGASQMWTGPITAADATPARRRRGGTIGWIVGAVGVLAALTMGVMQFRSPDAPADVVRSTIPRPPGSRFVAMGDYAGPVVVSPDGKRIAFTANDADLSRMLWVRELSALESRPIPGTEGATFPFWSPDGRSLGFFVDRRMMRVDVSGGLPITLCDAPNGRGGSWGTSDIIVFSPRFQEGIYKVPATGGIPTAVTRLDTVNQSSHRWPEMLPDGEHFLYIAVHHDVSRSDQYAVFFASIDGSENKRLMPATTGVVYAAGHLLYVRESTLLAVPFDPVAGEITGAPVTMIDKVQSDPTTWRSAFSASENLLAYHQGSGEGGAATRLVVVDRSGKELATYEDAGVYYHLQLSPDGTKVAATGGAQRVAPGAGMDVMIFDLERDLRTRLSFKGAADVTPVWSPDGTEVAYATIYPGANVEPNLLTVAKADGSGERVIYQSPEEDIWLSDWSPDGKFIVYSVGEFVGIRSAIWVLPLTGNREPFQFVESMGYEDAGVVSPDGRWLAYVTLVDNTNQIYVAPFAPAVEAGGNPDDRRPFSKWQITSDADQGSFPLWNSSGEELFFIRADGNIWSVEVDGSGDTFRSGKIELLCRTDPWNFGRIGYDVFPDGQRFVVNSFSAYASPPITIVQNWTLDLSRGK